MDSITGTITRGYDGLDRLTSDATPQGTVTYTYDNAGRRASLTVPGQSVVNYTFDNANRLTQIAQGTTTVGFTYDAANRRATLTLPNGIVTSYSYDAASHLGGLTYTNGSATVGNLNLAFNIECSCCCEGPAKNDACPKCGAQISDLPEILWSGGLTGALDHSPDVTCVRNVIGPPEHVPCKAKPERFTGNGGPAHPQRRIRRLVN